jgi:cytosine/adenosine deaminase-related metal-dependent hydrolase
MAWLGPRVLDENGVHQGAVRVDEAGRVVEAVDDPPGDLDLEGLAAPAPVNAHTHLADRRARGLAEGRSLEEAVAPPDGAKHVFLREAGRGELVASIGEALEEVDAAGARAALDFREGGPEGARIAREAAAGSPVDLTVLGRPSRAEAFEEEADELAEVVDGLGVSGLNDQPRSVTEAQAAWAREHGKALGLHVSEGEREDVGLALSLDPDLLVHGTFFTRSDARQVAEAGVPVVVCPRANAVFGNRPPLETVHEEGVRWHLGTDNAMFHPARVWDEVARVAGWEPGVPAPALLEAACSHPLEGGPRLRPGDRAVVLDDADGLDRALREARVTDFRRETLARR